jgi:hypothetical protein
MGMPLETKMSHLFKRLTLSVAAHFVNSLPLASARMQKQRRRMQRLLVSGKPIDGRIGNGH